MSESEYSYVAPEDEDEDLEAGIMLIQSPVQEDFGTLDEQLAKLRAENEANISGEKKFGKSNKYYDDENLGDNFETTPWLPPSIDKAIDYRSRTMFRGGNAALSSVKVCRAPDLGSGMALFFQFVRSIGIALIVMSFLSLPSLYFAFNGSRLPLEDRDGMSFYLFSLGNIGYDPNSPTYAVDSACKHNHQLMSVNETCLTVFPGYEFSMSEVGSIITLMEILQIFVFFCAVYHLHRRINSIGDELDRLITSVTDYSIMVRKLPADTTEQELMKHFSDLYPLDKPDWANRPPLQGARPVQSVDNTHNEMYKGTWIAECTVFPRIGKMLEAFLERQHYTVELRRARAEMKMYSDGTPHAGGPNRKRYRKAERRLNKHSAAIDRLAERMLSMKSKTFAANKSVEEGASDRSNMTTKDEKQALHADAVSGFVIFEYSESMARCLEDYEKYNSFPYKFFRPEKLKFKGKFLDVIKAPEPDQVGWEYLEISTFWKQFYRTLTGIIAIVILLICFAIIVQGSIYKTKFSSEIPNLSLCNADIPMDYAYAENITNYGKYELVRVPTALQSEYDAKCKEVAPKTFYAVMAESQQYFTNTMVIYNFSSCLISSSDDSNSGLCPHPIGQQNNQFCPCVSTTSSELCHSLGCYINSPDSTLFCHDFEASVIGSCYCYKTLTDMIQVKGVSATLNYIKNSRKDVCFPFFQKYVTSTALTYGATVVTVVVNAVLKYMLVKLTKLECHSQIDMKQASLMVKLFLSTYFNMALVVLIAFGNIDWLPNELEKSQIFQGTFKDFTPQWYGSVGSFLVLTFVIQILTLPLNDLFFYCIINPVKRTYLYPHIRSQNSHSIAMQDELNELEVSVEFDVVLTTSQMLALLFYSMTYASGLPILTPLCCLTFVIYFSIYKRLLCRFYKRPAKIDDAIIRTVVRFMPYAALIRLAFGCWILSNNSILPNSFPMYSFKTPSLNGVQLTVSASSYVHYLSRLKYRIHSVGPNILPLAQFRLLQPNVFPLLVIFLAVVLAKLIIAIWPYLPIHLMRWLSQFIYKTYLKKKKKVYVDDQGIAFVEQVGFDLLKDGHPYRQEMAPFTGDYFQYVCDKDDLAAYALMSCVNKLCLNFTCSCCCSHHAKVSPDGVPALDDDALNQGWVQIDQGKYIIKSKIWRETTMFRGVTRVRGEYKRTYEVVVDGGCINSYNLMHVPAYRMAYMGLIEGANNVKINKKSSQKSKKKHKGDAVNTEINEAELDWKKSVSPPSRQTNYLKSESSDEDDDDDDDDDDEDEDSDDDEDDTDEDDNDEDDDDDEDDEGDDEDDATAKSSPKSK